jgi:hypothetical protein
MNRRRGVGRIRSRRFGWRWTGSAVELDARYGGDRSEIEDSLSLFIVDDDDAIDG